MIPEKLLIAGLYSYQERVEIDFTKLIAAHLFGIFGNVGSGKSSILEAIMYAIYGKTERMNAKGDDRNYNMMNLRSKKLEIDFTFSVADGTRYRATVHAKRGKKHEDVKTHERAAYIEKNATWIPVELSLLEDAIGLSYDNFKRTVIIPQGKFQEFLHLTGGDRSKMLKDIFNLHQFDLGKQTGLLRSKNKEALDLNSGELKSYEAATAEILEQQEQETEALKRKASALQEAFDTNSQKEIRWAEAAKNFTELNDKQKALSEKMLQKESMAKREKALKNYQEATVQFDALLKNQTKLIKNSAENTVQLKEASMQLYATQKNMEALKPKLAAVETAYKNLDQDKEARKQLEKQKQALQLIEKCATLAKRQKDGEGKLKEKHAESKASVEALELAEKTFEKLKHQLAKFEDVPRIENWFAQKLSFQERLNATEKEVQKTQMAILENKTSLTQIAEKWNLKPDDKTFSISFENKKKQLDSDQETVQKELGKQRLKSELAHISNTLQPGDACPVCGATEHPETTSALHTTDAIEKLQKEIKALNQKQSALSANVAQSAEKQKRLIELQNELAVLNTDQTKLQTVLENHKNTYAYAKFLPEPNEVSIATLTQQAKAEKLALHAAETQLKTARHNEKKVNEEVAQFEKLYHAIETDFKINSNKLETVQSEVGSKEIAALRSDNEIDTKSVALAKHIEETEQLYAQLNKQIQETEKSHAAFSASFNYLTKQAEKLTAEASELKENLKKQLAASTFDDLNEVQEILKTALNSEKEAEEISSFKQTVHTLSERIKDLQATTAFSDFDKDSYVALKTQNESDKKALALAQEAFTKAKAALALINTQLAHKKTLLQKQEALEKRADNIAVIDKLMRGSGFVDYISSVYLREICHTANDRFMKLTRNSLSMEIDDKNSFQVRDFLNGGKTRNAKTLSGGQTFQASLALALALADRIQQQQKAKQNFFFLDEGFGSQDKESLQIVFESLKELRKENRAVGIISHVEELQQEIPVYINIKKDPEKGSLVEFSF